MENIVVNLIKEEKSSLSEVVENLISQKSGTAWAEKTNVFAIAYAEKLGQVYGDSWYKGFLPLEYLFHIKLPKHGHTIEEIKEDVLIFPDDTAVMDAKGFYESNNKKNTQDCLELINNLKEDIRKNGFKTSLVLVKINGILKHVDGLHRMIALSLLVEEGYEYKPISVFLCDSTKEK